MKRVWYFAVALAACDIPTELPKWNPTFAVALEGTSIPVTQLLPSSVAVADNTHFVLALGPVTFSRTLGQLCSACNAVNGQTVPKPQFSAAFSESIALPADIAGVTISSGWIRFSVAHTLAFDPLRPGGGATGNLIVSVRTPEGVLLGSQTISGSQRSFPPGSALTDSIAVSGTTDSFLAGVILNSPAGAPARIDTAAGFTITTTPARLLLTDVQLRVVGRQITGQQLQVNLSGIDQFIINRVRGGRLVLSITNGFNAAGTMMLNISGGGMQISKSVTFPAGGGKVEIPFAESELESMLGNALVVSFSGVVSSDATVTLTPASAFALTAMLVLELGPDS